MVSDIAMQKLTEAIQQISYSKDVATLKTLICTWAREVVNADGASLILKEGDDCYYAEEDAISPLWKGLRLATEKCIGGWSMRHKRGVVIADIHGDARINQAMYANTFVCSLMMAPIRPDDPMAAIGVYWSKKYTPTKLETEHLQILATCTAASLENVELMTKLNTKFTERTSSLLISQQVAETANKTKTRFLSAASHDLRQPLQNLSAHCAILARKFKDADLVRHVNKMQQTISGMNQLLNAILDLNQLENGGLTLDLHDLQLESMLGELRAEFTEIADAKALQLDIPTVSAQVHSDPEILLQILRNLLGNALKYTQTGQVSVHCDAVAGNVNISVKDSGPGIPEDKQAKIFDAFYQIQRDRGSKGGFGLGLAIVKGLAELVNHKVSIESTLGQGSVFTVQVPVSENEHSHIEASQDPVITPATSPKATLLYLEDDEDIIQAISTLLTIEGYQVITAETGEKAISVLQDQLLVPDLVITDNRLADDESGVEVVQRVRLMAKRDIPAIMLTGYTEKTVHAEALETVQKVLSKPVDADLLLREVAAMLESG